MLLKTKLFPLSPSGSDPTLITKTITANGNYSASDDGADGYSDVTVAVASKFASLVDRSITTVTAEDLAGAIAIGSNAFYDCRSLISVELPDGIVQIRNGAFQDCSNMTRIVIPNTVMGFGNYALRNNKITEVNIPEGVDLIPYGLCNYDERLLTVTIPSSVNKISSIAFDHCTSLTSITILATVPPALDDISAFNSTNNCPIYVPAASVDAYKAATNWAALSDRIFAIPSLAFTSNGDGTCYVSGIGTITDTDVVIPLFSPDGDTVVAIGDGAFNDNRNITSVEFSPAIQTIGSLAFSQNTSITSLVIPSNISLSSIGQRAFQYCTAIHSALDLGENLTSIGEGAFYESRNLLEITIRATTPPTLENSNAFYSSTNPYPIFVPAANADTYKTATNWSALASRIFALAPQTPSEGLAYGTPSAGVVGVAGIGTCTDTDIVIPISHEAALVKQVNPWSFYGNTAITSVVMSSVTAIYGNAFNSCTSLQSVTIYCNNVIYRENTMAFQNTTCNFYVPSTLVNSYKESPQWSDLSDRIFAIQ